MKFLKFLLVIFISLTTSIKADSNKSLIDEIKDGGKLIFIRHTLAPGNGDPANFNLNDCSTQRNLSEKGRDQAKNIGKFFNINKLWVEKVFSSEWCRCKETADLAFNNFKTQKFLNSFYSRKFEKNRIGQILDLKKFVKELNDRENVVLVTHYVVISELLNYTPSSGEIVVSDRNFNVIGNIETSY